MMYSVGRDVAMMSLLMNRNSYYYGAAPGTYSSGPSFLGTLVMLALVGFAVSHMFQSRSGVARY
jgi:hypothetical protein